MAEKKIKEIGTYEVKYNKQLRGSESEAFFYNLLIKSQNKRSFSCFFFLFYLLKKIKCLTWGVTGGRRGKQKGMGK